MGNFNMTPENHYLKEYTNSDDFENLIKSQHVLKALRQIPFTSFGQTEKAVLNLQQMKTGISDYHKLTYTFLKSAYGKGKPKFVYYRCSKNFNKELFKKNLSKNLKNIGNLFEVFHETFTNTLDCYAPLKKNKNSFCS